MGKADIGTKAFLKIADIFAELFNTMVFYGEEGILPEDLTELDSVDDKVFDLAKGQLKFVERTRDIKKLAKMGVQFRIVLGAEEQTSVHYYMPVRCMQYDAMDYDCQCSRIRAEALNNDKGFRAVTGIPKGSKILPVVTLVFYVGKESWDGPLELYDMFEIPEGKREWVKKYIPNYPIHIIDARHLTDGQIEQFHSDELKAFFYMIRDNYDEEKIKGYIAKYKETWYAVSAIKNDRRYVKYYNEEAEQSIDGGVRVDAVLDRIERRGEIRGERRGEKRGESIGISLSAKVFRAVKNGMDDNEKIAKECNCSKELVGKIREEFGI